MNSDARNHGTGDNRDEQTSCTLPPPPPRKSPPVDEMTIATALPPPPPPKAPKAPTPAPQPAYIPTPMPAPAPAAKSPPPAEPQHGNSGVGKPPAFLVPGSVLGRCRIEKLLGRGGMGAVYLARHTTLDILVAVKVMFPEIAIAKPEFADRFMREAKLASRIRQTNVIQVMDAEHDEKTGLYYIVQEYIDGGTTRELLREGVLPKIQVLDIAIGVTQALVAAAEFRIVHRDIKPENVMLTKKGEVKLADLGIAKECGETDENLTVSQVMMGTPAYIAPEQARDAKEVDARADIYSLGATIYHLLCGAPPHTGDTTYSIISKLINEPTPDPRQRRPDLSAPFAELIMRMIDKHRDNRPKSAAALLEELQAIRATMNAAVPTPMPESSPVPAKEKASAKIRLPANLPRWLNARIIAIAGLGILVLAMFCGWLLQRQAAAKQNRTSYDTEMAEAQKAFDNREYELARTKVQSAVKRFAEDSEEGMNAGDLQRKITTASFERTEKFNSAIAEARAPQTKNERALDQTTLARDLFPKDSPEWKTAQDLIDQLKKFGEKTAVNPKESPVTAGATAAELAAKKAEDEKAKLLAEKADAELAAKKAEDEKAKLLAEKADAELAAKKAEDEKAKLLAELAAKKAEDEKAKLLAEKMAKKTDAENAALAKQALEEQQKTAEAQKKFNALLDNARTALANKKLDAAQQTAELALPMFPANSKEWVDAQLLINEIAKAKLAVSTTPAIAVNPPVNPPVTTPTTPAGALPAANLGLIGLFKGKPGATAKDLINKTCYLRVNLWNDPVTKITTTNYHKGSIIPAGSQVMVTRANPREIQFTVTATGTKCSILMQHGKKEPLTDLQHRYFAEQNPLLTDVYQRFSQTEKDAIRDGKIFKDMNKEAVLMAYGYPPSHRTENLDINSWIYWIDRTGDVHFRVDFVDQKVSGFQSDPPGKPPPTF